MDRVKLIKQRIEQALNPNSLSVFDESQMHAGHQGAIESGGGHYNVCVVSKHFTDRSAIERHRMIYLALTDIMGTEVHALSIKAQTPEEAALEKLG